MSDGTTYLYGDSTPSPLETDFIAFLRDVFAFGAQVLQCDSRIAEAARRVDALSERTEREIESAEALAVHLSQALDGAGVGQGDSIAASCAARIRQSAQQLVSSEAEAARAGVTAERNIAAQTATRERDACLKALEGLVLAHSLPDAVTFARLRLEGGLRYEAHLGGSLPYGLEWLVALAIPEAHPMAGILRVERVVARLEIEAPEAAGWLHKEVKIRRQRFDRLYVSEFSLDSEQTTIKLRAAPDGSGGGYDVGHLRDTGRIQLSRILEGGVAPDAPYKVVGEDAGKLRDFRDALVAMMEELAGHKKSLVKASLDGKPIQQVDSPREIVDRIVANIAPKVHEIAKRSLTPGELVLKRVLSDNRREELFVSMSELHGKLQSLPPEARGAFEPLALSTHRSWRAPAPAEVRTPKDERASQGSWRAAAQPVVVVSNFARPPSQPPDAASSPGSARSPSQPPHA